MTNTPCYIEKRSEAVFKHRGIAVIRSWWLVWPWKGGPEWFNPFICHREPKALTQFSVTLIVTFIIYELISKVCLAAWGWSFFTPFLKKRIFPKDVCSLETRTIIWSNSCIILPKAIKSRFWEGTPTHLYIYFNVFWEYWEFFIKPIV